jgi:type I restriction enzyme S subunit
MPPLSEYLEVVKEKKDLPLPIYSVTLRDGMQRRETLGRNVLSELEGKDNLFAAKGDICYNMMRMWQGASGSAPEDCHVSPAYIVCRPRPNLDSAYASYLLKSEKAIKKFIDRSQGVTSDRWRLYPDEFLKISLFIPPLPEQKKIAEILSGIDKRIKLARQRVSQLEALIKSLGQNYFGTANQYDMKSIGELFEISSGTTPSRTRKEYFCRKDGTPWVKTMDLNDHYIRNTDECLTDAGIQEGKARIFPKGTLLVAMYGGWNQIGRTGILVQNSSCNQAMSALLPTKEVLPEFLNLQLTIRRSYWKGVAASSRKDPNITKSDVAAMPIVIPPVEDQLEMAKILGSVMNSCQKEERYLDSLNLLKQSVANDLLSGRKRVSV